jgi:hypothetical protein
MERWIVWYDDFSSFCSDDYEPWEIPRDGVICIAVERDSCGRYLISSRSYYCWHFQENQWVCHDRDGERQYLRKPGKEKVVLEGYEVSKDFYQEIKHHALEVDDRLHPRTAKGPQWQIDDT